MVEGAPRFAAMRWGRLPLAVLGALSLALAALGAQVVPVKAGGACQLKLDGPIEEGDADKLSVALDGLGSTGGFDSRNIRVCLNSPGGNYD